MIGENRKPNFFTHLLGRERAHRCRSDLRGYSMNSSWSWSLPWKIPVYLRQQSGHSVDVLPLLPEFVEAPGGEGAAVADGSVEKHLLELGNRGGSKNQIMLFRVRVGAGGR